MQQRKLKNEHCESHFPARHEFIKRKKAQNLFRLGRKVERTMHRVPRYLLDRKPPGESPAHKVKLDELLCLSSFSVLKAPARPITVMPVLSEFIHDANEWKKFPHLRFSSFFRQLKIGKKMFNKWRLTVEHNRNRVSQRYATDIAIGFCFLESISLTLNARL